MSSREQLEGKAVHQIIAFGGSGKLRDGKAASIEFREFLGHISSDLLQQYAENCLTDSFRDSGLALQDIVNQVGRRLGFEVADGRYRGGSKYIGNDGLWTLSSGHSIIIEVKTTDAYRIDLNTIAGYRKALVKQGDIAEEKSSALIVVGRHDTGDLEAQIRGSRYAWDIRLISVDALMRLMRLKEALDDPETMERIHALLIPREFTKLDEIVDIVFSTAEEVQQDDDDEASGDDEPHVETKEKKKKKFTPVRFHSACVERIEKQLSCTLIKRSRSYYSSPKDEIGVICSVSKEHERAHGTSYWFAFHPYYPERLEKHGQKFIAWGCGSEKQLILMPLLSDNQ